MKILDFFLFLWVLFALLDPDPATQINADPYPGPDPKPCVVVLHLTFVLFQTRAQLDSSHGRHPPEAAVRGRLPLLHLRVPGVLRMTQLSIPPAVILTAEHAESPVCHLGLSL
jgi:hypothetical protein